MINILHHKMAFLDRFPKSPTMEELMVNFQRFLTTQAHPMGRTLPADQMRDTVHTGMFLLRHLPFARDSVFEYISMVYEDFVKEYMSQAVDVTNSAQITYPEEEVQLLEDIHNAFILYLDSSGQIWAPILSQWTLQLLGQLSSQFSSKTVFGHCQSVNEVIQIWMGCKAVQSLLDLTSRSLTCRDHANEDAFISALLDTSATHSPHFDWVVAHVGNSYPQTIVSKVLELGLLNFSSNPPTISKLSSVAGILGHLVTTHAKEVQHAFHQTLEDALSGNQVSGRTTETFSIPYLLQLCSSSVALLDVLMDSTLPKIKGEALDKLIYLVPRWIQMHFGGQERAVLALVTHLILKSTRGPKALEILMSGCKAWSGNIGKKGRVLLDHFTSEISSLLYESDNSRKDFPCILALKENHSLLTRFLTDMDPQVCRTAKEFVKLLALYDGPAIGVTAACHYFRYATEDKHLWHLTDLISTLELKYATVLQDSLKILAVKSGLSSTQSKYRSCYSDEPLLIWKNILRLVKSEGMKQYPVRHKLSTVLQENLSILIPLIDVRKSSFSMEEASLIVEIISKLNIDHSKKTRFGDLLTLERYLVDYLFHVLLLVESKSKKANEVFHITQLLSELSENQAIQNDALRTLVQSSLDPDNRPLFMERVVLSKSSMTGFDVDNLYDNDEFQPERFSMYVPLMKENQKRTASVCLARVHSTSLHSGKLAKSEMRHWSASPKVHIKTNPDASVNLNLFLSVLLNICMAIPSPNGENGKGGKDHHHGRNSQVSSEAMRKIALLLVEVVSPDVMFNGLPWPEEEFSKVQVERDLQIRRAFENHPYLWDLLEIVANHCPSLCYCSVLLRALMATLMAHWTSSQESKSRNSPIQLEWTIRLLNIMKTGQLLPPPLCYVGQIIHELKANEVLHLLRDIWGYMRVNVPVPALFIKDPATKLFNRNSDFMKVDLAFTEKLRLVLLNNVETLGFHYPKFFPGNYNYPPPPNKNGTATENGTINSYANSPKP